MADESSPCMKIRGSGGRPDRHLNELTLTHGGRDDRRYQMLKIPLQSSKPSN